MKTENKHDDKELQESFNELIKKIDREIDKYKCKFDFNLSQIQPCAWVILIIVIVTGIYLIK